MALIQRRFSKGSIPTDLIYIHIHPLFISLRSTPHEDTQFNTILISCLINTNTNHFIYSNFTSVKSLNSHVTIKVEVRVTFKRLRIYKIAQIRVIYK